MKSVNIKFEDPSLRVAAEKATRELDRVIGASADFVTAVWTKSSDAKQRPLLKVQVSDPFAFGEAATQLAPEEVDRPEHLYERMLVLWGDLLQSQNDASLKQLNEARVARD